MKRVHLQNIIIAILFALVVGLIYLQSAKLTQAPDSTPTPPIVGFDRYDTEPITTETITDTSNKYLDIKATIPVGVVGAIDIKNRVLNIIQTFKTDNDLSKMTPEDLTTIGMDTGRQYTLQITSSVYHNKNFITHRLDIYTFTGGAHGGTEVQTFTYDTNGQNITLPAMLLDEHTIYSLANLIQDKLLHDPTMKDRVDPSMLTDGTMPSTDNFKAFAFDKDTLRFIFQQYQVGPYVSGIIELPVPLTELKDILTPRYLKID